MEAHGLLHQRLTFDGEVVEVFSHGTSSRRIDVAGIERIQRKDGRKGSLEVIVHLHAGTLAMAFDAANRPAAEVLLDAVEAARPR
jgi:hypothetical protein